MLLAGVLPADAGTARARRSGGRCAGGSPRRAVGPDARRRVPATSSSASPTRLGDRGRRGMCFSEDRLVQTLLGHPDVRRLIVAETPRSLPVKLAQGPPATRRRRSPPASAPRSTARCACARADPRGLAAVERCFRAWDARARRVAARRGLERPALITTHPLIAGFAPLEWASSVTFYAYDDLAESPPLRRLWPAYEEAYRRVRERGRAVAAVSPAILETIEPDRAQRRRAQRRRPGGVDVPGPRPGMVCRASRARGSCTSAASSLASTSRPSPAPREGCPGASFVLVGPLLDAGHFEALRREPNVFLRPPVAEGRGRRPRCRGRCLPDPSCSQRPLTEAMSPLKLYEYLAGGSPVAALDLPPIRGVSPRVVIRGELGRGDRRGARDLGPRRRPSAAGSRRRTPGAAPGQMRGWSLASRPTGPN